MTRPGDVTEAHPLAESLGTISMPQCNPIDPNMTRDGHNIRPFHPELAFRVSEL